MITRRRIAVSLCSLAAPLAVVSVLAGGQQGKPRVNADAALSAEFLKGIQQYVDLHKKQEATLKPRPEQATPAEIDAHEQALAKLIIGARSVLLTVITVLAEPESALAAMKVTV